MFKSKAVRSSDGSTKQGVATNVVKAVLCPRYADKGTLKCEIRVTERGGQKQERDCHLACPHLMQHRKVAICRYDLTVKNSQVAALEIAQLGYSAGAHYPKAWQHLVL